LGEKKDRVKESVEIYTGQKYKEEGKQAGEQNRPRKILDIYIDTEYKKNLAVCPIGLPFGLFRRFPAQALPHECMPVAVLDIPCLLSV
jgi:hypothetical protein